MSKAPKLQLRHSKYDNTGPKSKKTANQQDLSTKSSTQNYFDHLNIKIQDHISVRNDSDTVQELRPSINDIRSVTEVIRANPNKTVTSTMIDPHAITQDISYLTLSSMVGFRNLTFCWISEGNWRIKVSSCLTTGTKQK